MSQNVENNPKRQKSVLERISALFLSIFLSYMVVIWPIEDYPKRIIILLVISTILYYIIVSFRLFRFDNPLISYIIKRNKKNDINHINKVLIRCWFVTSFILGMGSVFLVILTKYYLDLADKYFGGPGAEFGKYYYMADKLPLKIYIPIIIAFSIFFILQAVLATRIKGVKKSIIFGLSFLSTIIVMALCMLSILAGMVIYYVGGSIFY